MYSRGLLLDGKWAKLPRPVARTSRAKKSLGKSASINAWNRKSVQWEMRVTHCTVLVEQSFDRGPLLFGPSLVHDLRTTEPSRNRGYISVVPLVPVAVKLSTGCRTASLVPVAASGAVWSGVQRWFRVRRDLASRLHPQASRSVFHTTLTPTCVIEITLFVHRGLTLRGCRGSSDPPRCTWGIPAECEKRMFAARRIRRSRQTWSPLRFICRGSYFYETVASGRTIAGRTVFLRHSVPRVLVTARTFPSW